ncbi:MAG: hypothetical protein ACOYK9_02200, partial [Chlamydiia bacterium]
TIVILINWILSIARPASRGSIAYLRGAKPTFRDASLFKGQLQENYWDIPKSAFGCRGSKLNTTHLIEDRLVEDCCGAHYPEEPIALEIANFLDYFQASYKKRLTILIGWRCSEHERFIGAKDSYQTGDRVIVRLEGMSRKELKTLMEPLLPPNSPLKILDEGFSLEDQDLWGESQTIQVRLLRKKRGE